MKLAAALAYVACSMTMLLGNKAITFLHNVDGIQMATVLFQNAVAVVLLLALQSHNGGGEVIAREVIREVLPLVFFFTLKLLSSLVAYQHVGIATFTLVKSVGTIFTVGGEHLCFGTVITAQTIVAFAVMILAVLFYVKFDVQFSAVGYMWCTFNCVVSTGYLLFMQRITAKSKYSKKTLVYYINLASVPLLASAVLLRGEATAVIEAIHVASPLFLAVNVVVAVVGGLLGFVSLWTVHTLGAGAYSFIGALLKVPVVLIGTLLFGDVLTLYSGAFCALGILASVIFSIGESAKQPCQCSCSRQQLRSLGLTTFLVLALLAVGSVLREQNRERELEHPDLSAVVGPLGNHSLVGSMAAKQGGLKAAGASIDAGKANAPAKNGTLASDQPRLSSS